MNTATTIPSHPPAAPPLLRLLRIVAVLLALAVLVACIKLSVGLGLIHDVARPPTDAGADAADGGAP